MTQALPDLAPPRHRRKLSVACINFLNTRPLIYGLDRLEHLDLLFDVPSGLLEKLRTGAADVGLLPVIDYQRLDGLRIVPSACIGCDGPTFTVRLFAQQPIEQTKVLACDTDSHTSVVLARIILAESYGLRPECLDLHRGRGLPGEARLLIGDKVVCEEPAGFEYQLDLGEAWKKLTGLPFVFATWVARAGVDLGDLPQRLERAKQQGLAHVDELIRKYAVPRGWPAGLALQYLTMYLRFDLGERQLDAIRLFHTLAAKHGLIDTPPKPLRIHGKD